MKLYYLPGACSMVPHTALEWTGQTYQAERASRQLIKSPDYLQLNPQGAVPLLVDGELVLSQNVAILFYLDAKFPQARLFGSDTVEGKARAWRWLAFLNSDVHKAFSPLFRLPDYLTDEASKAAARSAAQANIVGLLSQIDAQLARQPQLGDALSVADVYAYVMLRWARGMKIDLGGLAHLGSFYDRVCANAGIQAVVAQEDVPA